VLEKDLVGKRPLGRSGKKRCKCLRWRIRLERMIIRQRWLKGGMFDGMVIAAVLPEEEEEV